MKHTSKCFTSQLNPLRKKRIRACKYEINILLLYNLCVCVCVVSWISKNFQLKLNMQKFPPPRRCHSERQCRGSTDALLCKAVLVVHELNEGLIVLNHFSLQSERRSTEGSGLGSEFLGSLLKWTPDR